MITQGTFSIAGQDLNVLALSEDELLATKLGAVEDMRVRNDYVTYLISNTLVESTPFTVAFYFYKGHVRRVALYLLSDVGAEWKGKEWEESYLEMLAQAHAQWLGDALGLARPVWQAVFDWGKLSVAIDKKGWSAGILVTPLQDPAASGETQ